MKTKQKVFNHLAASFKGGRHGDAFFALLQVVLGVSFIILISLVICSPE